MNLSILTLLVVGLAATCDAGHLVGQDKLMRVNLVRQSRRDKLIFEHQFASIGDHLNRMNMLRNDALSYIGEIKVGTPAKVFHVLLDSGSGILWLPSSQCKKLNQTIIKTFDHEQSSSFRDEARPVSIRYMNQIVVKGYLARETIQFGDLHMQNRTFMLVNDISSSTLLEHFQFDGILGLNLESINYYGDVEPPIIEMMRLAGQQSNGKSVSMLSLSLNHGPDASRAGELILGGLDESLYVGEVAWAPLMHHKEWLFRLDSIELNYPEKTLWLGAKEGLNVCPHGCSAVADTGTMVIVGPPKDIHRINEAIGAFELQGTGFVLPNCENLDDWLPTLTISISGRRFSLTPRQYTFGKTGPKGEMCFPIFVIMDPNIQYWILGNMFIGHFYTIVDYDNFRFGLAESAHKTPANIIDIQATR